eukprot:gene44814-57291_t
MNEHGIANVAHAVAKAQVDKVEANAFLSRVAEEVRRRHANAGGLREFNAQGLANLSWAFAKAESAQCAELFPIVAEEVRRRHADAGCLRDFNAQNLANLSWAFAKAESA